MDIDLDPMKGINILYDSKGRKRQLQIDIAVLENNPEAVEDILDVIVCGSRRNEPAISLAELKKRIGRSKKR
ncbi:MAG: hypothetical protein IPK99_01615 [Flavobacteriales bacterium]|nr:hypothetical protein [Flavobacteriales bacterium]